MLPIYTFNSSAVIYIIQVIKGMLAYSLKEYVGELYRITLSTCAGDEKRFIFVIWGTANVTEREYLIIYSRSHYDYNDIVFWST